MMIQTRNPVMERLRTQREISDSSRLTPSLQRRGERGYALVALLAVMTIMALLLVSAAPSIQHQTQRSL
jgi:type II secretory pathway pseudopilin PulG